MRGGGKIPTSGQQPSSAGSEKRRCDRHLGLAPRHAAAAVPPLQRGSRWTPQAASPRDGILPWSPLGGGWLTGKYRRDVAPTGTTRLGDDPGRGMEAFGRRNPEERTWRVIDAVRSVAEARGASMAQVALAWLVDRPAVTSVILGARTLEQLDDNLGAAGLHLSAVETALLDEASAPIVDDYPYGELGVDQRDRGIPGP